MTRWLCLALVILACTDDPLYDARCTELCYTGPENTAGVGICHTGLPLCEDGVFISCQDEQTPLPELCNGVDDDCDGREDENPEDGELGTACGPVDLDVSSRSHCRLGRIICGNGHLECQGEIGPVAETCNGMDDDCDTYIDNNIPTTSVCYSGKVEELVPINTSCRAGTVYCSRGREKCRGEILPQPEVCNHEDDDCDGIADNISSDTDYAVDIVLLIDQSGSMSVLLHGIVEALTEFIFTHQEDVYRYAIVDLPGPTSPAASLRVPLSPAALSLAQLAFIDASHTSEEPSYDALIYISDGRIPVEWRPDAHHLVLFFGDEDGQTLSDYTEEDAGVALATAGIIFYGVVSPDYWTDYDGIARLSNGDLYDIYGPKADLEALLPKIFEQHCEP